MTSGLTAMISRKIQRPVIAAMPAPVTIGSRPRHQLMRVRWRSRSLARGASTERGRAASAVRNWRANTRSGPREPSTAMSSAGDVDDGQHGAAGLDVLARPPAPPAR